MQFEWNKCEDKKWLQKVEGSGQNLKTGARET